MAVHQADQKSPLNSSLKAAGQAGAMPSIPDVATREVRPL